jgi:hypothetical protein
MNSISLKNVEGHYSQALGANLTKNVNHVKNKLIFIAIHHTFIDSIAARVYDVLRYIEYYTLYHVIYFMYLKL